MSDWIDSATLRERMFEFAEFLRAKRFSCSTDTLLDVATVFVSGAIVSPVALKQTCKPCVCKNPDQWKRFDNLFDLYWRPLDEQIDDKRDCNDTTLNDGNQLTQNRLVGFSAASSDETTAHSDTGAGDMKTLSLADFRFVFDRQQMLMIEQMVDDLTRQIHRQRKRRTRNSTKRGAIDMRRSLRSALGYKGHVAQLAYRQPVKKLPSLVLLLDVSQSMEIYSRLFLRFTRQIMTEFNQSTAFAFNTQLFELGKGDKKLNEHDFEQLMNSQGKGWLGGTQIASSFEQFNNEYAQRLVNSKCTVIIFSDGHDTAKPENLVPHMRDLHRRARKIIWVNPLLGRKPQEAPDPRMAHVLPWITEYCSGHNLQSLKALTRHILN